MCTRMFAHSSPSGVVPLAGQVLPSPFAIGTLSLLHALIGVAGVAGVGLQKQLFDDIKDGHVAAVKDAESLAQQWASLRGLIDDQRFYGVKSRFRQQINDAQTFAAIIVGYYGNVSGRTD